MSLWGEVLAELVREGQAAAVLLWLAAWAWAAVSARKRGLTS